MTTERRGIWAALAAALGLAACEDQYVITRQDRSPAFTRSHVTSLAAGGLPTEIHGVPFEGLTTEEVAARLTGPQTYPDTLRFRAIEPGSLPAGNNRRLVLVFNRAGNPNRQADCRGGAIPTQAPRDVGFSVSATFCAGDQWDATAHMEAQNTRADDPEAFARVMRLLFREIFP